MAEYKNLKQEIAKTNEIKINPEYSKLVYHLSKKEHEVLKNSIKEDGLHYPIIVNPKREILDGHNRYIICTELEIPIKYEIKHFVSPIEEKKFIIDINLKRRHLVDFQKAELAYKLEDIYKEQAKLRQLSKLNNVKDKLPLGSNDHNGQEKGRVIEVISKQHDLSPKTYQRAKTIIEYGPEEIKENLRQGKSTISKEYEKIQKDRKRSEFLAKIEKSDDNNNEENDQSKNYKLIYGDFIEQSQKEIKDNSIYLIFTDPPYGAEYLPLYQELAKLAIRVLKPGGSLVFLVGHIILDQVIKIFDDFSLANDIKSNGLKYWWTFGVKHSGHHKKVDPRHVFAEWKPMLWYTKGQKVNDLVVSNTINDFIVSRPPSKLHNWEQSSVEAEHIITNLTLKNLTVLDPMMGTGTTGIAALNLKRRFIGIEINHETFLIAKSRFANMTLTDSM